MEDLIHEYVEFMYSIKNRSPFWRVQKEALYRHQHLKLERNHNQNKLCEKRIFSRKRKKNKFP